MSSLNLLPNPALIVAHTGIFLANLYVVKKLMIEPYLKLRDRRAALTTGSQLEAKKIHELCDSKNQLIEQRISGAIANIKAFHHDRKEEAGKAQDSLVADTKAQVKRYGDEVRKQLADNLQGERTKISTAVERLAEEVFSAVIR